MEDATVETQLAVINAKLDVLIQQRAEDRERDARIDNDHEDRIRSLESARWKLVGLGVGAGFMAGFIAPYIQV